MRVAVPVYIYVWGLYFSLSGIMSVCESQYGTTAWLIIEFCFPQWDEGNQSWRIQRNDSTVTSQQVLQLQQHWRSTHPYSEKLVLFQRFYDGPWGKFLHTYCYHNDISCLNLVKIERNCFLGHGNGLLDNKYQYQPFSGDNNQQCVVIFLSLYPFRLLTVWYLFRTVTERADVCFGLFKINARRI